jgi:hypothetical protein
VLVINEHQGQYEQNCKERLSKFQYVVSMLLNLPIKDVTKKLLTGGQYLGVSLFEKQQQRGNSLCYLTFWK